MEGAAVDPTGHPLLEELHEEDPAFFDARFDPSRCRPEPLYAAAQCATHNNKIGVARHFHFTTFPSVVSGGVACQSWGGGVCSCVRPSVLFLVHRGTQRCSLFAQCSVRSEQVVQGYTLAQKTHFHSFNQLHSTHTALTRCCLSTHTTDSPTPSSKGALSQTRSSSCRQELLGWRQSSTHRYVWACGYARSGHFIFLDHKNDGLSSIG